MKQGAKSPNTSQKPRKSFSDRLDGIINYLDSVPESTMSYRHWPAKYQKEMKWLFISIIPILILGITVPVPMLLGVLGWYVNWYNNNRISLRDAA